MHGAPDSAAAEPIAIEEAERIDLATDVRRGIWRGLFRYELRATTEHDIRLVLERLRWTRTDLLAALDAWGESAAEWDEQLRAHAVAEVDVLGKLGARVSIRWPEASRERLAAARAATEERFAALLPGDRERLAVFDGEKWTTRKVLRCLVVGERRLLRALRVHSPR